MAPIPERGMVAVTGAAGYLGGWVARLLLERGYRVRACVRDANDESKAGFLKALPGYASGRLTLHSADLDVDGCFDEIFQGCNGVAHVSHVSDYNDQDYVTRVCAHVIESVNRSETVSRVVLTSSVAAVISEMDLQEIVRRPVFYEDRYPDELNPRRTPERGQGYSMGKLVVAPERRLRPEAAEVSGRWDAINWRARATAQRRPRPIQSPHQKNGALAAQHRGHAGRPLHPERRLPPVDDRGRARRRPLPHRPSGERRGEERRTLHRLVDRHARRRADLP